MSLRDKKWPRLFTCPVGVTDEDVARDDLGTVVINPVYSNQEKMVKDTEGCDGCDSRDDCNGPVEYVLKKGD